MNLPKPANETARIEALHRYRILDSTPEDAFDDLARLAAQVCEAPIALLSLVDASREWFKARVGLEPTETPREVSFSAQAIEGPEDLFVVRDALRDARFRDNPLVTAPPAIRFYAGATLVTPDGFALGTLCVLDRVPRDLSPHQAAALRILRRQVVSQLELRRLRFEFHQALEGGRREVEEIERLNRGLEDLHERERSSARGEQARLKEEAANILERVSDAFVALDTEWRYTYVNEKAAQIFGRRREDLIGKHIWTEFPEGVSQPFHRAYERAMATQTPVFLEEYYPANDRWFENRIYPSPEGLAIFFNDITDRKRAEEQLRESQQRLELMARASRTGLWDWNLRTNEVHFSRELKSQIGYAEDQIADRYEEWEKRVHPEDLPGVMARIRDYLENPQGDFQNEFRFQHKDGSYRSILAQASVMKDDQGRPVRMLGSHIDITELKQAEEALRETERRWRLLVENSPALICTHDLEGRLLSVNEPAVSALGYPREELLGKKISELIPPAYRDQFSVYLERIKRNRQDEGYLQLMTSSGESRIFLYRNLLHEGNGHGPYVLGIALDVTEQRRAESELRKSQEHLQMVMHGSNTGIWDWDLRTNRVYFSPEWKQQLGYSEEEIANTLAEWENRLHPEDHDRAVAATMSYVKDPTPVFENEFRLRHKDGTYRHILTRASVVRDASGRPARMFGIHVDITRQKVLEEQLRRAQKMESVGRLAGGVAHDFNNLLTVISGYVELTLEKMAGKGPHVEALLEVRRAANRAASLTRQLLAFSRQQILAPQTLHLNDLVADMGKMLRRLIGEDIDLITRLAPNLGWVKADPTQLEQVILNLAVNARDAMPEGGRLIIETANAELNGEYAASHSEVKPGSYVMLAVTDTGIGMDKATQALIFEPFFTTKESAKGTGLGLSTVYGIVKQSRGYIWVYSELGQGTTFKIYLPRVEEPESAAPRPHLESKGTQGSETILLVEDEEGVRQLTEEILNKQGYRVLSAANPEEALNRVAEHSGPIHLLVSDLVMPGGSGRNLAERLQRALPDLKVLFISGYTDTAAVSNGGLDERHPFLQKPFSPDDFVRKVRDVLDR